MVYGFITTRYFTLNQLSFGKTRKEIYFDLIQKGEINSFSFGGFGTPKTLFEVEDD